MATRKKRDVAAQEQPHIPGTEPVKNKKVHLAARRYYNLMHERIAAGKDEKEAEQSLLAIMAEEKVEAYEYNGLCVVLNKKVKPKVTLQGHEAGDKDKEEDKDE